ncbi:MAG: carboxylating nicotinate-nucleotide diphosphorylase [Pseudomonadota bacterium]
MNDQLTTAETEAMFESVARALSEDIGGGDVTAALVPHDKHGLAHVVAKESGVLCGTPWFDRVFAALDPGVRVSWARHDGDRVEVGDEVCRLEGRARTLLTGERAALNFLQTLSGTATVTRRYADQLADTPCQILDTRKTLPGLRLAQKYAVRVGGGKNHRMGLYDMVLIKENHIAAAGSIGAAVAVARETAPDLPIEVEVESMAQLDDAVAARVDRVMLDEFSDEDMLRAVECVHAIDGPRPAIEVSGNVTLERLRGIAATGVDFISSGALTKHVRALDLSMRMLN